jgi:hypothetical protein
VPAVREDFTQLCDPTVSRGVTPGCVRVEHFVLWIAISRTETEVDPPAGDEVDDGRFLGDLNGGAQRASRTAVPSRTFRVTAAIAASIVNGRVR